LNKQLATEETLEVVKLFTSTQCGWPQSGFNRGRWIQDKGKILVGWDSLISTAEVEKQEKTTVLWWI